MVGFETLSEQKSSSSDKNTQVEWDSRTQKANQTDLSFEKV